MVQRFDTETGEWLDQVFTAADDSSYETSYGETETDSGEDVEDLFPDKDLPLEMVQPFQQKQRIEWDNGTKWVELESDGVGSGELNSNLGMKCPYCDAKDCYGDCKMSQWHLMDDETRETQRNQMFKDSDEIDKELESLTEMVARERYNSAIDVLESFILSLACTGRNLTELAEALCRSVELAMIAYKDEIANGN